MTTYRYFANVMARTEFTVEAESPEKADAIAIGMVDNKGWEEFTETGIEIGRIEFSSDDGVRWTEVHRAGDI